MIKIWESIKKNPSKYITLAIGLLGLILANSSIVIGSELEFIIELASYFLVYFGFDEEAIKLIETIKEYVETKGE